MPVNTTVYYLKTKLSKYERKIKLDPHIGHLYSLSIADTFARHARLSAPKRRVVFTTGTDEHGMKIQKAAQERGMEPNELCDRLSLRFSVRNPLNAFPLSS